MCSKNSVWFSFEVKGPYAPQFIGQFSNALYCEWWTHTPSHITGFIQFKTSRSIRPRWTELYPDAIIRPIAVADYLSYKQPYPSSLQTSFGAPRLPKQPAPKVDPHSLVPTKFINKKTKKVNLKKFRAANDGASPTDLLPVQVQWVHYYVDGAPACTPCKCASLKPCTGACVPK